MTRPAAWYKDQHWHTVRLAAQAAGIPEKEEGAGRMRELHRRMYDEAKTAAECRAVRDEALAMVDVIADEPKLLTIEERLDAQDAEIAELRAKRA